MYVLIVTKTSTNSIISANYTPAGPEYQLAGEQTNGLLAGEKFCNDVAGLSPFHGAMVCSFNTSQ